MSLSFACLIALILYTNAQSIDDQFKINMDECGMRIHDLKPYRPYKIIGGNRADPEDWGWQVALNFTDRIICGGALINSRWILTASHCVFGRVNPIEFKVDIGLSDRINPEPWAVSRGVSKIVIHPSFSISDLRNDIALMKLDQAVKYSEQIVPVCLPDGSINYSGKESWATGWGSMVTGGASSRYLLEVKMPFLTDQRCKQKFPSIDSNLSLCAGETGENKDTCQADAGGALVVQHETDKRWYIAGITSWGYGCGDGGVYTRTSTYLDWIRDTLVS